MSSIDELIAFTIGFNRYFPICVFIFGIIGNILNILIFRRRSLCNNPCCLYLLNGTYMNILILLFGLVIRSLMDGFNIDIIGNNLILCRLRYIILHPSYALSTWFIVLSSIDRFCISSKNIHLRHLSNIIIARRMIIILSFICLLLYSHILGLFEIEQLKTGPYCFAKVGYYRLFYDFLFLISYSLFPCILMMIFGLSTLYNIHLTRNKVIPKRLSSNSTKTMVIYLSKKDRQLIIMILIQLIVTIICTLPHSIQKLYSTITINSLKSPLRIAIENLIIQITRQLMYINASINFYLYIILSSSSAFRHEFRQIIILLFSKNNRIHDLFQHSMESKSRIDHTIQMKRITTHHVRDN